MILRSLLMVATPYGIPHNVMSNLMCLLLSISYLFTTRLFFFLYLPTVYHVSLVITYLASIFYHVSPNFIWRISQQYITYLPTINYVSPNCISCIPLYKVPRHDILRCISQLHIMYLPTVHRVSLFIKYLATTFYLVSPNCISCTTVYHVSFNNISCISQLYICISFYKIPRHSILRCISQLYIMYLSALYRVSLFIRYLATTFSLVSPNCISCISQQ